MAGSLSENASPNKSFRIIRETEGEAARLTADFLAREVAAAYGPRAEKFFALAARAEDGRWIGGINGLIHWRWLYIGQFFVEPAARRRGVGRKLIAEAEILARENQCVGLYLDTFDAKALAFYGKAGFAVVGRIDNFPPGAARTFLCKALTPASA